MKNDKKNKTLRINNLHVKLAKIQPIVSILFLILLIVLYGYMIFQINNFKDAQPTSAQVSSDLVATSPPEINPRTVKRIEQMKNNSVSVQALFDTSRSNPFN